MKVYDKLVRDKIPSIIEADGRSCDVVVAEKCDMANLLERKLEEEVNEYLKDKNLDELADVMEVLFGLAYNLGYSEDDLLEKRRIKYEERGGFKDGIVLKVIKGE